VIIPNARYQNGMQSPKPNRIELILTTAALAIAGFAFYTAAVIILGAVG